MTLSSLVKPQSPSPDECRTEPAHPLTVRRGHQPHRAFQETRRVNQDNPSRGFAPAFLDPATGTIHLARYADGRPAPIHLLAGVPLERVVSRDAAGTDASGKPDLIAGFVRAGRFYTREQAADSG